MTQQHHDHRWDDQLNRLDGRRRGVVVRALEHSTGSGWPPSDEAVRLLVDYALGQISAQDYATGILHSMGLSDQDLEALEVPAYVPTSYTAGEVEGHAGPDRVEAPQNAAPRRTQREDAVQAYVNGQIPVSEFLRIARE